MNYVITCQLLNGVPEISVYGRAGGGQ